MAIGLSASGLATQSNGTSYSGQTSSACTCGTWIQGATNTNITMLTFSKTSYSECILYISKVGGYGVRVN